MFVAVRTIRNGGGGRTVTRKVQNSAFPDRSLAVQVTGVRPRGKTDPDGGLHVTADAGPQSSLAEALQETSAPWPLVACATMLDGQARRGGVVSSTSTRNVHDEVPERSDAVQSTR